MGSSTDVVSTPAIADHPIRAALLLGALGVVFGDIGTSPIYAFKNHSGRPVMLLRKRPCSAYSH